MIGENSLVFVNLSGRIGIDITPLDTIPYSHITTPLLFETCPEDTLIFHLNREHDHSCFYKLDTKKQLKPLMNLFFHYFSLNTQILAKNEKKICIKYFLYLLQSFKNQVSVVLGYVLLGFISLSDAANLLCQFAAILFPIVSNFNQHTKVELCKGYILVQYTFVAANQILLIILCLDRVYAIYRPFEYRQKVDMRKNRIESKFCRSKFDPESIFKIKNKWYHRDSNPRKKGFSWYSGSSNTN